ncbi:hypothetical protein [Micrococcoides hystricis]|uniref:Uncharacterized protein n=1 Tax=Micrococcoides hystricis TaxID=1572761 RepID=A0ABV6PBK7_9MICC
MKSTAEKLPAGRIRKLLGAVLIPLFMVLTAFGAQAAPEIDDSFSTSHLKFHENGTVDSTMDMKMSSKLRYSLGLGGDITCQKLFEMTPEDTSNVNVDNRSQGGNLHCLATSLNQPLSQLNQGGHQTVSLENGEYTVTMRNRSEDPVMFENQSRLILEFPGKVTQSSVGTVEGNKVILEGASLSTGGVIKAKASPGLEGWVMWLLIGLGVVALALFLWLVLRKKNKKSGQHPHQGHGPQGQPYPGQHQASHQQPGRHHGGPQQGWQPNPQQPAQQWRPQPGQQPPHSQQGQQWQPQQGQQPQQWQQPHPQQRPFNPNDPNQQGQGRPEQGNHQ